MIIKNCTQGSSSSNRNHACMLWVGGCCLGWAGAGYCADPGGLQVCLPEISTLACHLATAAHDGYGTILALLPLQDGGSLGTLTVPRYCMLGGWGVAGQAGPACPVWGSAVSFPCSC